MSFRQNIAILFFPFRIDKKSTQCPFNNISNMFNNAVLGNKYLVSVEIHLYKLFGKFNGFAFRKVIECLQKTQKMILRVIHIEFVWFGMLKIVNIFHISKNKRAPMLMPVLFFNRLLSFSFCLRISLSIVNCQLSIFFVLLQPLLFFPVTIAVR